jgi:PKD repeat protein
VLPPPNWTLIDVYFAGNWMVRGYGETVYDIPWLSETPTSGSVLPGECTTVDVTFDSTGVAPGDYNAGLLIESNDADDPEITIPVTMTVLQPADISGVTYTATNLQVAFDAAVVGEPPLTFAWTFGDGGTSNLEDPTYTYAAGGCYTVTFTVSNGCGQDTWTEQVCVCDPVSGVDFSWSPLAPLINQTTYFSATVAAGTPPFTFVWDWGDGTTGSGEYATHAYVDPGTYTVVLTVTNDCGQAVVQHQVTVVMPDIEVTAPPLDATLCPDATDVISFTICNVGTAPLTWSLSEVPGTGWLSEDPTNGTLPPTGCVDVGVTFDSTGVAPGDYNAGLLIESNDADDPEITIPVTMTVLQPADITNVTYAATNLQVAFDATVVGELPLTFAWTFGDGGTASVEDPTYTYAAGGCYSVTLTVSNGCGQDTWTGQVCVCEAATGAGFTWTPTAPVAGDTIDFSGTIVAGTPPFTWSWDFGDSGTGAGQNVSHAYTAAGDYLVTLTVLNACGQAVAEHTLTVGSFFHYFYLPVVYKNYVAAP